MSILVGWFLAPDKDYALRGMLATQKLLEIQAGKASFHLKIKAFCAKRLTSKTILADPRQIN